MFIVESELDDLFGLMLPVGLAAIIEERTGEPVAFRWSDESGCEIDAGPLDLPGAASLVRDFAAEVSRPDAWLGAVDDFGGAPRGTLSPRVGRFPDRASWQDWFAARRRVIDTVPDQAVAQWRMIGALGEPAHWATGREPNPDLGASAWEMKTRNRGEDLLRNRLAPIAEAVAGRDVGAVAAGLDGTAPCDEVGKDRSDSRTPTGLRAPGAADNVQALCALWGISVFPVRPNPPSVSVPAPRSHTAGAFRHDGTQWFAFPVVHRPVALAAFRAIARSAALEAVGRAAVGDERTGSVPMTAAEADAAQGRLRARGVVGVSLFRKQFSDNPNAPEPWAVFERFAYLGGQDG